MKGDSEEELKGHIGRDSEESDEIFILREGKGIMKSVDVTVTTQKWVYYVCYVLYVFYDLAIYPLFVLFYSLGNFNIGSKHLSHRH